MYPYKSYRRRLPLRGGFTLLELQVAIVLLAFAVVTLASLMTTQQRLLKRLRGDFKQSATVFVTRSKDPWVKKLQAPARLTAAEFTPTTAPSVTALNNVDIVDEAMDLKSESITVTADVTPIN